VENLPALHRLIRNGEGVKPPNDRSKPEEPPKVTGEKKREKQRGGRKRSECVAAREEALTLWLAPCGLTGKERGARLDTAKISASKRARVSRSGRA